MKNWTGLKFASEIYNGLCAFFGADPAETTEAELHTQLTQAGTLESIRAAAIAEANEAVKTQMEDFKNSLATLTTQFEGLKADAEEKTGKVAELETHLETVRGELESKNAEIAGQLAQIKTLSGTVASLQAGKPLDRETPAEEGMPGIKAASGTTARVVSSEEIEAVMAKMN